MIWESGCTDFFLNMIQKHKVMREKNNSAEYVGCSKIESKFESVAWELRIQLQWSDILRFVIWRHIFLPKKLSLINFRGEKCHSRGRLPRKEQNRNKLLDCLSFAELDWLIRTINSIRVGLLWPNNGNYWDNLTPLRNVLRSIFVDWANLTGCDSSDCF